MKMYLIALPFVVAVYHWLFSQKVTNLVDDLKFLRAARMELVRRQQQHLASMTTTPPVA
jgi:hypothetical protein